MSISRRTRSIGWGVPDILHFYWTSTAAMHIMPVSLSWRRRGAAAVAKTRDTPKEYACAAWMSLIARD
jgi:hypothetical protein